MSKRDPKLLLDDILDAIRKIQQFTQGLDFAAFLEDEKTHDAVIRNFEVIGEAVNQLPQQLLSAHPEVQWHRIVGVRNRVIHEYFGVDLAIIWSIIKNDLENFQKQIEQIS